MPKTQLDALMWAQACAAMERAERLRRQFFHHATPHWEAPIDVFETDDALIILIALPGVELERVKVTYQEHAQILRHVLRRQADSASLLLRSHVTASKSEVRKITLHMLYEARRDLAEHKAAGD